MKVILLADVQGQGKKGDIVEVNEGYARNFLLPKKLAAEATKSVLNELAQRLEKEERIRKAEKDAALALAKQLQGSRVDVFVKCGEGKLYGSVTTQNVADALAALGHDIDKRKITIKESIKQLGVFDAEIKIYKEISATIKIEVKAK